MKKRWIVHIALALAVFALGLGAASVLKGSRAAPEQKAKVKRGPLVEVASVHSGDAQVVVEGDGTVEPRVKVQLIPQVSGRVIALHPRFVPGGSFKRGETLIRIDPRDYRVAVQRARAAVARAEVQLELEKAEAAAARREWERINEGEVGPPNPLVLKEPQVKRAEAELAAARADLSTAKLNLERTRLSLPFDGRVLTKNIDIGQFVTTGKPVATLYGTRNLEVRIPLQDSELRWLKIPGFNASADEASAATLEARFAGAAQVWPAHVVRLEGQLDPVSRMAYVVLGVEGDSDQGMTMLPGTFVHARIEGLRLHDAHWIPRPALRDDDTVWIYADGVLTFRHVDVVRSDRRWAYVSGGIGDHDKVIVSALDAVTDGMKVRAANVGEDS